MMTVPYVLDGKSQSDIFSRLLKDRVITLWGEINETSSQLVVAQLLFLDSVDSKKPIQMYINSPGGSIVEGYAIIDTMHHIDAPVHVVCVGMCASMGALILSQGAKGYRYALPRAEVMIHQPLGGAKGQATDIEISARRIVKMKEDISIMLSEACNQPIEKIRQDCERDYYLTAKEALEYGIIDKILTK